MDVIVLGASGTFPTVEGAASGFLVLGGDTKVWLDAGPGTFQNLQRYVDFQDLDAVVLSHTHLDHILDFYSFYYGLRYGIASRGPHALRVFAPAGTEEYLALLKPDGFAGYFDFQVLEGGDRLQLGTMDWTFAITCHPVTTLACRVEHEGRSFTYTADTAPSDEVTSLARGCDVLIAEASLQEPVEHLKQVHMTALEAGQMATAAGVGRLVLTHISPGLDPEVSVKMAADHFSGELVVARDHLIVTV